MQPVLFCNYRPAISQSTVPADRGIFFSNSRNFHTSLEHEFFEEYSYATVQQIYRITTASENIILHYIIRIIFVIKLILRTCLRAENALYAESDDPASYFFLAKNRAKNPTQESKRKLLNY